MKSTVLSVLFGLSVLLSTCHGHGYIHQSRSQLCTASAGNKNKNCGNVQWEPQSLECLKGFPEQGPQDGFIASAQLSQFHELDAVGAERWSLTPISTYVTGEKDGKLVLDFPWTLTAPHMTTDFKYFISKKTFDPTKPIARDQLELTPFCVDDSAKGTRPPHSYVSRGCTLDTTGYSGHHVILGVWSIDDTVNAFYQVIDVDFPKDSKPNPSTSAPGITKLCTPESSTAESSTAESSTAESSTFELSISESSNSDSATRLFGVWCGLLILFSMVL